MKISFKSQIKSIDDELIFIILFGILIRIFFFYHYETFSFNDTVGYKNLALQIKNLDFTKYNGTRTPVYPLLILLSGLNDQTLWFYQSLIGILISVVLYKISYNELGNKKVSVIIGLSYSLCLNLLFFEANVLSETLATFLFVLSCLLFIRCFNDGGKSGFFVLGLITGLLVLTRPLFLCLVPVQLLFVILKTRGHDKRKRILWSILILIPIILLTGGWCVFNKIRVDYFGLTTYAGFNLLHHSGKLIMDSPPEFSGIRDAYLRDSTVNMWFRIGDMQKASGLSFGQLSAALTKMSIQIFLSHPIEYLKSVGDSWMNFWSVVNYWNIPTIQPQSAVFWIKIFWEIERVILITINILFLVIGLISSYLYFFRKSHDFWLMAFLFLSIFTASICQAVMENVENGRYAIPFQPFVLLNVFVFVWIVYRTRYFKTFFPNRV